MALAKDITVCAGGHLLGSGFMSDIDAEPEDVGFEEETAADPLRTHVEVENLSKESFVYRLL